MYVAGIVLCGGRSSRMGRPKAWLPVGGEVMLHRVVRVLREAVDPVLVVAAPGQDVSPLSAEIEIVRDEIEGRGPLGGLAAGLVALQGRADAAYLSACDVPFLTAEFVRGVVEALPNPLTPSPKKEGGASGAESRAVREVSEASCSPPFLGEGPGARLLFAAVPHADGRPHPLAAAYRLTVLPEVQGMLAEGAFRMTALFDRVPTRFLAADELPDLRPLRNVNTLEEYEAVLRELGG